MRKYWITIGPRNAPRLAFEAMAEDSVQATEQHVSLAQPGERMDVVAIPDDDDDFLAADLHYLRNRQARERARLSELTQWEITCARLQGVCS